MTTKYSDVEMAFEMVSSAQLGENEAYVNIHTGETHWYSSFGDNEQELPDDITDEHKYLALPHKNELNLGKKLVLRFTYQFLPEEEDKIESIFRQRGAYQRFKSILESRSLLEQWYEYENKAQEEALREWCELYELKIVD